MPPKKLPAVVPKYEPDSGEDLPDDCTWTPLSIHNRKHNSEAPCAKCGSKWTEISCWYCRKAFHLTCSSPSVPHEVFCPWACSGCRKKLAPSQLAWLDDVLGADLAEGLLSVADGPLPRKPAVQRALESLSGLDSKLLAQHEAALRSARRRKADTFGKSMGPCLTERQQLKLLLSGTGREPSPTAKPRPSFVYASTDSDSDSDSEPRVQAGPIVARPQVKARGVKPSRPLAAAIRAPVVSAVPAPPQKPVVPAAEPTRPCSMCLSAVSPSGSAVIDRCCGSGCQVVVHRECYGARDCQYWFCDKCYAVGHYEKGNNAKLSHPCVICGLYSPEAPMRRVVCDSPPGPPQFVHVVCAAAYSDRLDEIPSETPFTSRAPVFRIPPSIRAVSVVAQPAIRVAKPWSQRWKPASNRIDKIPSETPFTSRTPVFHIPPSIQAVSKPAVHVAQPSLQRRKPARKRKYPTRKLASDADWSGIESHSDEESAHWYLKHGKYKQRGQRAAVPVADVAPAVVENPQQAARVPGAADVVANEPAVDTGGALPSAPSLAPKPPPAPSVSPRPMSLPSPSSSPASPPSPSQHSQPIVLAPSSDGLTAGPTPNRQASSHMLIESQQYQPPAFASPGGSPTVDSDLFTSLGLRQANEAYSTKMDVLRLLWERRKSGLFAFFDPGNCTELQTVQLGNVFSSQVVSDKRVSSFIRPGSVVLTSGGLSFLGTDQDPTP